MDLNVNGLRVSIAEAEIAALVRQRLLNRETARLGTSSRLLDMPALGAVWHGEGGLFTGLIRGRDGARDRVLITGPRFDDADRDWETVKELVDAVEVDGHHDFRLPFRKEQALQFANVPELFKEAYYWSCEPCAPGSDYAWSQSFVSGNQSFCRQSSKLYGCAVRSFEI